MNKEKIEILIEKYGYMFREFRRSNEVYRRYKILSDELLDAKNNGDEIKKCYISEENEKNGSYYPIVFGFECDDGWFELIEELMREIEKIDKEKIANICQVKEKFGGLNFRLDTSNEEISKIVRDYESRSYKVCEVCGAQGERCKAGHWYKTVCENHREIETWAEIKQNYVPVKKDKEE